MKLLHAPDWCAQEEYDGTRMLLGYRANEVYALDRLGRRVAPPAGFILASLALGPEFLLDGEAVDETYHAFDLLELARCDLRPMPLGQRLEVLSDLLHGKDYWAIKQVPTARLRWEKEAMFETLRGERRKGIVFKHLGEPCWSGEEERDFSSRKLSFRPSITCRVVGYAGGRRINLAGQDEEARPVKCSVKIPDPQPLPPVGMRMEVAYRDVTALGELLAPVFVRRREDFVVGVHPIGFLTDR